MNNTRTGSVALSSICNGFAIGMEDSKSSAWRPGHYRQYAESSTLSRQGGHVSGIFNSTPSRQNSYSLDSESSSLNTTHSARNLGFILSLMNILPSLIKFRPSPKLAITISDSFVVSVLTLIPTQLAPLPPPSFTPNSIAVILSTTYLSLRSPACLQQIQNSLARVVVKTPK